LRLNTNALMMYFDEALRVLNNNPVVLIINNLMEISPIINRAIISKVNWVFKKKSDGMNKFSITWNMKRVKEDR